MSKLNDKPEYTWLNQLASEKVDGRILFATDDWFATAENLLKVAPPTWQEGVFTEYGKWMDGWETRRKRQTGHDWCVIELGLPGIIHGFNVDTAYFTGNYPPNVSIQAACLDRDYAARPTRQMGTAATQSELSEIKKLDSDKWEVILPMSKLKPGYLATRHNYFAVHRKKRWTHIRLNLFPDGGVARLDVFGQAVPKWDSMAHGQPVDLVAAENGGVCLGCSNFHFGHPRNMIGPGRAANMGDGWETARRLDRPPILTADEKSILQLPGFDWAVFRLGHPGRVLEIEVDTNHFKGNFPDNCRIEACLINKDQDDDLMKHVRQARWTVLLSPQKLSANKRHFFRSEVVGSEVIDHVRLSMAPDGGISRLKIRGFREACASAKL